MKSIRYTVLFFLALTVTVGAGFRLAGLGFGIDREAQQVLAWHPDEIEWLAGSLLTDLDSLNTHYHYYGSAHIYLLFLLNLFLFGLAKLTGAAAGMGYAEFIYASGIERQIAARLVSVLFSLASVVLIYRVGQIIFDRKTAIFAVLLLALNPISIIHAHYATVDSAFMFWILATYLALWLLYKSGPDRRRIVTTGLLLGIAIGTKYNAGILLAMLITAVISSKNLRFRSILPILVLAGAVFLITNPYDILDFQAFRRQLLYNIKLDGAFQADAGFYLGYLDYLSPKILGRYIGGTILLMSLAGLLLFGAGQPRDTLVLLAHPLLYFLVVGSFDERTPRHMMPVLPFILLFGAYALSRFHDFLSLKLPAIPAAVPVVLLLGTCLAGPVRMDIFSTGLMVREDTRIKAGRWVAANIPGGSKVVVDRNGEYSPLLSPDEYDVGAHDFKPGDAVNSFEDVVEGGYEFFIASELMYMVNNPRDVTGLYPSLANDPRSILVALFEGVDQTYNFHHPTIRIYRIAAAQAAQSPAPGSPEPVATP